MDGTEDLSNLRALEEAERRHDGPIPEGVKNVIRFGSPLASRIAAERQEVEFYRGMLMRAVKAGKGWRERGDAKMVEANRNNAQAYLKAWRHRRRTLRDLEAIDRREGK